MTRHSSTSFKTILVNNQVRSNARPSGMPGPEAWRFTKQPVAEPADNFAHLKNIPDFAGDVDYHAGDVFWQMARLCPAGIDVHFDLRCYRQAGGGEARHGDPSFL